MKIIPNVQHIENDLIRRAIVCIVVIFILPFNFVLNVVVSSYKFLKEYIYYTFDDMYDVWKKSPYRQNKYVFHDFKRDDF